jgi:hypothetical protein
MAEREAAESPNGHPNGAAEAIQDDQQVFELSREPLLDDEEEL